LSSPGIIHFDSISEKLYQQQPLRDQASSPMSELPQLRDAIEAATQTLRPLSSLEPQMAQAADVIDQCLRAGKKLLVCGNGGSGQMLRILRWNLWCVLPKIAARFRRFVSPAIAEF